MTKRGSTKGLKAVAQAKKEESIQQVNEAIDRMKVQKIDIDFSSVARESGVSRQTLYNNSMIRERINSLKALGKKDAGKIQRAARSNVSDMEKQLREEVTRLRKDKKLLVEQLVDREELLQENQKLKNMVNRMKQQMQSLQ